MTISPERPLLPVVPLTGDVEGCSPTAPCASGRAAMTCLYRCGDACSHDAPNTSSNETFADVMAQVASRRGVLRAGAVIGAA
ncbi:phosphatase, partial [Aeromicrobium sp. CnD17-E]|nr:phosphatase [Aeromicrobium sp. CnD17-E]